MAEIPTLLRPQGTPERLRDWIVVALIRIGAIPVVALLVAALWWGIGVWAIPVVVAVSAAIVAGIYLTRRERELQGIMSEIMREEFDRTALEVSEVRAAWSSAPGASEPVLQGPALESSGSTSTSTK